MAEPRDSAALEGLLSLCRVKLETTATPPALPPLPHPIPQQNMPWINVATPPGRCSSPNESDETDESSFAGDETFVLPSNPIPKICVASGLDVPQIVYPLSFPVGNKSQPFLPPVMDAANLPPMPKSLPNFPFKLEQPHVQRPPIPFWAPQATTASPPPTAPPTLPSVKTTPTTSTTTSANIHRGRQAATDRCVQTGFVRITCPPDESDPMQRIYDVPMQIFRNFIHDQLKCPPKIEPMASDTRRFVETARLQLPFEVTGIRGVPQAKQTDKVERDGGSIDLGGSSGSPSSSKSALGVSRNTTGLKCAYCDKKCSSRSALIIHVRTHTGDRPFICDITGCGKKFSSNASLTKHRRTHDGHKPFGCHYENCSKRFSRKDRLKVHIRWHTGEKPEVCDFENCGKRFACKTYLNVHKKYHDNLRPHMCEVCMRGFVHKGDLNKHIKTGCRGNRTSAKRRRRKQ